MRQCSKIFLSRNYCTRTPNRVSTAAHHDAPPYVSVLLIMLISGCTLCFFVSTSCHFGRRFFSNFLRWTLTNAQRKKLQEIRVLAAQHSTKYLIACPFYTPPSKYKFAILNSISNFHPKLNPEAVRQGRSPVCSVRSCRIGRSSMNDGTCNITACPVVHTFPYVAYGHIRTQIFNLSQICSA
jgi:hypothetical protein